MESGSGLCHHADGRTRGVKSMAPSGLRQAMTFLFAALSFVLTFVISAAAADGILRLKNAFAYVDLLPALKGNRTSQHRGDAGAPHPNARGHVLMADAIYPVLALATLPPKGL
jgi:hypothetical protein